MNKPRNEIWEKSLLTLNDSVFFHIFKNYLGKIETPFNKHTLIGRIKKLFSNDDTRSRILQLMDRKDKLVLSAVYRLDFPEKKILESYLAQDFSYTEFHMLIQNLEERLIIFEYDHRLFINPLLFDLLLMPVLSRNWHIEMQPVQFSPEEQPWLTELRVFGILSALFHTSSAFGKSGEIRKKTIERLSSSFFPEKESQSPDSKAEGRTEQIVEILRHLGFFTVSGSEAVLKYRKIMDFGSLSMFDRIFYLWAGYTRYSDDDIELPGIRKLAEIISSFLHSLLPQTGYSRKSLISILGEIDIHLSPESKEHILNTLAQLSVIVSENERHGITPMLSLENQTAEPDGVGSIIFNSSLQFTLQNNYSYEALVLCSCTAHCIQADYFGQFEISKRSLHKGAVFFEEPVTKLYKKYAPSIAQSTCFTIEQWSEQMDDIALYSGITIAVKERHIPFFESLKEKLLIREISRGIYICDTDTFDLVERHLEEHDIYVPGIVGPGENQFSLSSKLTKFNAIHPSPVQISDPGNEEYNTPDFLDSLYSSLGSAKMTRKEKAEIEEKIKSKLILFPDQVDKHICRKDKVEARGIDFQGKLNLIQQAMKNGEDLLSVQYFSGDFDTRENLLLPVKLVKEETNYILEGRILPDETEFSKEVSQLSRVRRIRKSLYSF